MYIYVYHVLLISVSLSICLCLFEYVDIYLWISTFRRVNIQLRIHPRDMSENYEKYTRTYNNLEIKPVFIQK